MRARAAGFILSALAATALLAMPRAGNAGRSIRADTAAIALPFLRQSYIEGDSNGAYRRFSAADLIQHNPEMTDGLAARLAFFEARERAHPGQYPPAREWANVIDNIVIDGDLFAVHHHVFTGPNDPGRMFVDIWRVANGRIVEHWDVIQPVPTAFSNTNTMWCGQGSDYPAARRMGDTVTRPTCPIDRRASRVRSRRVIDAYVAQLTRGDVAGAVRRWFTPDYRQHSPGMADGIAGALSHLGGEFGQGEAAKPKDVISHVLADGDLVLMHRYVRHPGDGLGKVQVDLFRVTGDRISEHWDVKQPVVEHTASGRNQW